MEWFEWRPKAAAEEYLEWIKSNNEEGIRHNEKKEPKKESKKISYIPKRILINNQTTIVFWEDGTKTIVRCAADETFSVYNALASALAIKIYGSNSAVKRILKEKTSFQKVK